jgi:hypothetical protein
MRSESDFLDLGDEDLQAQRSARNMVKRDSVILFSIYSIGFILLIALILQKQMPLYLILSLLLVYFSR